MPHPPTESSGLRLLYAVLITACQTWRRVRMTPDIWHMLEALREKVFGGSREAAEIEKEAVTV